MVNICANLSLQQISYIISEAKQEQSNLSWRGRFRFRPDATNVALSDFQPNLDATVNTEGSVFKTTSFCVVQTERGIKALISFKYIEKDYVNDFTDLRREVVIKDIADFKIILGQKFNIFLRYEPMIPENKEEFY